MLGASMSGLDSHPVCVVLITGIDVQPAESVLCGFTGLIQGSGSALKNYVTPSYPVIPTVI
jgi:hypothetical protein